MYNKYKSVVSYDTTAIPLFSQGRFVILQDTIGQHFPHLSFSSYLRGCDGRREDNCLRLCGRWCGPILPWVQPRLPYLLRHEGSYWVLFPSVFNLPLLLLGGSLLWAELKDDCDGQLFQECRRDDWQTEDHLQQDSTGRHHWRADRDYFWRRRALSYQPFTSRLECGCLLCICGWRIKRITGVTRIESCFYRKGHMDNWGKWKDWNWIWIIKRSGEVDKRCGN